MKKHLCTFFLLLVLAIQALPITQMGRMLFSNQFTEEIPHSVEIDKGMGKNLLLKSDYLSLTNVSMGHSRDFFTGVHLPMPDALPKNHSDEIHVPPPNRVFA